MRLTIQHTGNSPKGPLFTLSNGETVTPPVSLPDPAKIQTEGYDNRAFPQNLRWYLEKYLDNPDSPNRRRAEATVAALQNWGTAVFDALFDRDTYQWYAAIRDGNRLKELQIRIISKSPVILSWPWEALCDNRRPGQRTGFFLAPHCCIERLPDPDFVPAPPAKETDRLRMLLVISRPDEVAEIGYHAEARALVDYVRENQLPIEIDVLRPPTFDNLWETLSKKGYHIVHFDGHGGYGLLPGAEAGRPEGFLVFEAKEESGQIIEPDFVGAWRIGQVLFQCGVPMVTLSACQSAMINGEAESAYASVAASLLHAGIRSVTAMGYSLYVSGAKQFVPAFYRQLFRSGVPGDAMREGRMAMFLHPKRGKTPLQDWIVPQLYQKVPAGVRILPQTAQSAYEPETGAVWPDESALKQDVGGFIGRGQNILELERILQRKKAPGILIHGMAGAGKTTLAKGFLGWLRDTGGLRSEDGTPCPVFWFDFRDIYSGTYIVDTLAAQLCEGGASSKNEKNLLSVVSLLNRRRAFLVWDNFESATGAPGTKANLSDEERQYLKGFLEGLWGGPSKVILTSRTGEGWLEDRICARIRRDLDGLRGKELWDYCGEIAEELDVRIDPEDGNLLALLHKLDGNPLAVRAVLLRLKDTSAAELLQQLDAAFRGAAGDESTRRIYGAFDVLTQGADADMFPVLQTLGLHEHYAVADDVENILRIIAGLTDPHSPEGRELHQRVTDCFALLENAGMCTHTGHNIYRVHPALRGCLAERYPAPKDVRLWFVRYMTFVEDRCHNTEEQRRAFFSLHEANIRHAQEIAEELDLQEDLRLTASLASNSVDRGDYGQAEALGLRLADKAQRHGSLEEEDRAYNQLSVLASRRGDREMEKRWAQKAADVWKNAGNLSADVLFTMGRNADTQGDYATAMNYWEQAAVLREREGDERVVGLYGALGALASMMGDDATAEKWSLKYWEAAKKHNNIPSMANASRTLATLAESQRNLPKAESWYLQSLALYQGLEDKQNISDTRWMLGNLYVKMSRPGDARKELEEAVILARQLNLKPMIADCYRSIGMVAIREGGFTEARENWEEALKLYEELKHEDAAAIVRENLQRLEQEERRIKGEPKPEALLQLLSQHPELLNLFGEDPKKEDNS